MSILSELKKLAGTKKRRHHPKKKAKAKARAKGPKPSKRMPKALREYWEKKRKR